MIFELWIREHGQARGGRYPFLQQAHALGTQLGIVRRHAGEVRARHGQCRDESDLKRIGDTGEDDWDRRRRMFGGE